MTRKQRRLVNIGLIGVVLAAAVGLILYALGDDIVFFQTPTHISENPPAPGKRLRIGGLVETGSVHKDGAKVDFSVTDTNATVRVAYVGLLPDLFREGQGVVVEGRLSPDGVFTADSVLAKHDEKYVPKEVVDALKAQGVWQEGQTATQ